MGHRASDLGLDTSIVDANQSNTRLVKGCPCYREFGEEKVCLNRDDVSPINAISVDPSFFEEIRSLDDLNEFKSDKESMCYLLIYLNREEGYCYCVSQGQRININKKDIKADEIDSALEFVTSTEKSKGGVICSACLYKYLRTLGEVSEGLLTDTERQEIVKRYVKELSSRLAAELSGASLSMDFEQLQQHLRKYIKKLNKSKSQWASLTMKLRDSNADEKLVKLVDYYRLLYRLEAVFLSRVLEFEEGHEDSDPLNTLRFIVGVSEKVIKLSDNIRETTHELLEMKKMNPEIQESLRKHSRNRQKTEYKFSNLVVVLNKIDAQTSP